MKALTALCLTLLLAAVAGLPQTALAQTPSPSKLSAHLINSYTPGASNIIAGSPRTLKVLGLDSGFPSGMVQAMRVYKAQVPAGKLVVRIYSPKSYSLADDATASATDFWNTILQQGLSYLAPADRALIDYLEGPNEGQTPTLGYPNADAQQALQSSQWFNQFWTNLTPLIVAAGYKPCIGSIAVGNPGGSPAEMQSYLAAFVPALRQAKAAGGAWSYHAYTIGYTTDPAEEYWYSLRYRQFYSYFASAFPDLNAMPLILTEGGVDAVGNPATSGWQARGSAADYQRWLNWFDQQLRQDPYVLGCTLFEIGNPESWGWPSFDLEPIAAWLGNYLKTPAAPPAAPSGVTAVNGVNNVTLNWANVPLSPTTWNVKRATNSAGPWFILATNLTAGVQSTSFTDATAANFVNYYYLVTAMNAAGESAGSVPIPVTLAPSVPAQLNCGGPATGGWIADAYYDSGTAFAVPDAIDTSAVASPAPVAVYQSQRYGGDYTYALPYLAPRQSYKVRLHFAEIYWTAAGQRVFDVFVNGARMLASFDIIQAAGGAFKANVQEFDAVSDAGGVILVRCAAIVDNASINGIELALNPVTSAPSAPVGLTAAVSDGLVTLSWTPPAQAAGFNIRRGLSAAGPFSLLASNVTLSTYRDTWFTPNNTYYYIASATNQFGESPSAGPVAARPVVGLPDVVVTAVTWTPATLFNGSRAVFSARVLNRGSAATPAGVPLGVGFNMDGAGTVAWSSAYNAALAPGASVTLTADGGPTGNYWTATPGLHYVVATVDDVNRFPEAIEDNNALSVPVFVGATNYAINSGGTAVGAFAADSFFAGSLNTLATTNAVATGAASNPAPAAVYQTARRGEFSYVLGNLVAGSNYTVRLHFAEISPAVNAAGERRFNVAVNGVQALTDFDVLAAAGGKFGAVTREIKKRADSSGTLQVDFKPGAAGEPLCCGIELFGSAPVAQPPVIGRLTTAGGTATVFWQGAAGALYQLQFKNLLSDPVWADAGPLVLGQGGTVSASDGPTGAGQRFYRVAQVN